MSEEVADGVSGVIESVIVGVMGVSEGMGVEEGKWVAEGVRVAEGNFVSVGVREEVRVGVMKRVRVTVRDTQPINAIPSRYLRLVMARP